jgi:putative tryptophan/tyrosine transport system substrate-binding protein
MSVNVMDRLPAICRLIAVLTLLLLLRSAPAAAQQGAKIWRIGVLERTSIELNAANLNAFRQGMQELGYVEGQHFVIEYRYSPEYRYTQGTSKELANLATALVRRNVDLILTRGTPQALAAMQATKTIPVVMAASGDPVGTGIVASLARPGGNVTGLSAFVVGLSAKRIELLREIVPGMARVAGLFNMSNPAIPPEWKEAERAARSLGIHPQLLDVRTAEDLGRAFDGATTQRADALVVGIDGLTQTHRRTIVGLAAKHRLPAIYASQEFVDADGLISYAVNYPHLYYRAASFVDKIFKGAKPANLPVEQPTKFELVINMKTAKTLGLTFPPSLLLRADQVID